MATDVCQRIISGTTGVSGRAILFTTKLGSSTVKKYDRTGVKEIPQAVLDNCETKLTNRFDETNYYG